MAEPFFFECCNIGYNIKYHRKAIYKMMNITLNSEQERLITEQLAHGKYQSADEVMTKALQLLARQQQEYTDWVADVRIKTDEAAAELARGEGIPLDTFMAEIRAKFQRSREVNG